MLHQDDFYKDEETLTRENVFYDDDLKYHNWELAECFDGERFRREVLRLRDDHGAAAAAPTRTNHVIVVEGILVFEDPVISSSMSKRYFLHLPVDECRKRRSKRCYEPPEPRGYFDKYYWPSYVDLKRRMDVQVAEGNLAVTYLDSENESIDALLDTMMKDVRDIFGILD